METKRPPRSANEGCLAITFSSFSAFTALPAFPSLRLGVLGFSDGFIIIGRIKLGMISTPGGLLDRKINIPEPVGRYAQGDCLTDSHDYIPGDHFNSGWRKSFVVPLFPELGVDFIQRFRLVVA